MLPFFAWKIFSISFFISLDFYLQVLSLFYNNALRDFILAYTLSSITRFSAALFLAASIIA